MTLFELQATLGLDSEQFDAALKNAKSSANGLGVDVGKEFGTAKSATDEFTTSASDAEVAVSGLMGQFTASNIIASAIRSITDEMIEMGKEAINLSSDLTEVENVTNTVFGENATAVEMWSKRALDTIGISELQAKNFAGIVGNMFKSVGVEGDELFKQTTDFINLSADMASFFNTDVETMVDKMMSGMEGSAKSLRDYGIDLTVGSMDAFLQEQGRGEYNDLDYNEKLLARWDYLNEKTADIQGDYLRTQDSYANQYRKLASQKEEILSGFNIAAETNLVSIANEFLDLLTPNYTILDAISDLESKGASDTEKYAALMAEETRVAREKALADNAALQYQEALNASRERGQAIAEAYNMTYEEYVAAITGASTAEKDNIELMNQLTNARISASEDVRGADTEFRNEIEGYSELRTQANELAAQYETDSARFEQAASSVSGYSATMDSLITQTGEAASGLESVESADASIDGSGLNALSGSADTATGKTTSLISKLSALLGYDGKTINIGVNYSTSGSTGLPGRAVGIDYVPYNGYTAALHEGEMVLTRLEAERFRKNEERGMNDTSGGVGATAAEIGAAVAAALSGLGIDIDGKRAGKLLRKGSSDAQNKHNLSVARGYGY